MGLINSFKKLTRPKDDRGIRLRPRGFAKRFADKTVIVLVKKCYKLKCPYDKRKNCYCVIFKNPEDEEQYFFISRGKVIKYQMRKLLETNLEKVPLKVRRRHSPKGYYIMFTAVDDTLPSRLRLKFR